MLIQSVNSGSAMAITLKNTLIPNVVRSLSQLYASFSGSAPPPHTVDVAISSSFRQLDSDIMNDGITALNDPTSSLTETISRLAPFFAGSCALLAVFDPNTQLLRTACVGDSRAVLGRPNPSSSSSSPEGKYTTEVLSIDQTGFNPLELEKLAREHPGETDVVDPATGRVLGIMISRAFGDGLWKWPLDIIARCKDRYNWKPPRPGYRSPPYLTAEPVITTTKIAGREFCILATDGLWDNISSEEAVGLVEMWITAKRMGTIGRRNPTAAVPASLVKGQQAEEKGDGNLTWKNKLRQQDVVVEDENCAVHLVRNAFGGADRVRLLGSMGTKAPYSRHVRDDVTVQVIFFGEDV